MQTIGIFINKINCKRSGFRFLKYELLITDYLNIYDNYYDYMKLLLGIWNVLIEMNWNYRYDLFDILICKIVLFYCIMNISIM